ncbi:hypothetical protein O181_027051 [Austropuccinia psidii MF-1]|uniref:Uncharacterized protein n=1 Tax=Austropuccinia psidii MF-1 TaxID=1389203 RepID=A0A9Q3CLK6_9BASI|nr:hypothetical protein [Austropuccinia psidii MF-1]
MVHGPWGYWRPPGPKWTPWAQFGWVPRDSMGPKNGPWSKTSPTWPGHIEGVQDHQDPGLPKVAGEALGDELSPKEPLANRFHSQVIPSTPRTFQPVLASIPTTIPPSSPSNSHSRPALNPEVRPSPIQKPRNSPITTSQQLQPMAGSSRRRDGLPPFPFPDTQVFQRRDHWPIQITREHPNAESENQEAAARFFRRVNRNSREVIMYANNRTIPGTSSEEMAAKFARYEEEFISEFQRTFDD